MGELSQSTCEACKSDAPKVSSAELDEFRGEIPDWLVKDVGGIPQLHKEYKFKNFKEAMAFANKVGELAEREQHHPALLVEWGQVKVCWWTHKIGGLHRNDLIMAAKTDQLRAL